MANVKHMLEDAQFKFIISCVFMRAYLLCTVPCTASSMCVMKKCVRAMSATLYELSKEYNSSSSEWSEESTVIIHQNDERIKKKRNKLMIFYDARCDISRISFRRTEMLLQSLKIQTKQTSVRCLHFAAYVGFFYINFGGGGGVVVIYNNGAGMQIYVPAMHALHTFSLTAPRTHTGTSTGNCAESVRLSSHIFVTLLRVYAR